MYTNKRRVLSCVLILAVLVSLPAFAAPMTSNPFTMPKATSTGAHGANEVPEGKSPITGLNWTGTYRPIVVQMENSTAARPHLNMSEADIVYEAVYWGPAHTRYTLIFNDNYPELVASVRSARVYHCEIRQEWDAPFVFWGGQQDKGTSIYDFMKENNVPDSFRFDGTKGGSYNNALFRLSTRVSPHNAAANIKKLVEEYWPTNKETGEPYRPRQHALKFSSTSPTRGDKTAVEVNIRYDEKGEYNPMYTFNAQTREYERWYDGKEQIDGESGKRIVASNVIVQYCDLRFSNNIAARPIIPTTGTGPIDAFIDGQHIRGTWDRKQLADRTVFMDLAGNELTLLPGKTFIQIIPSFQTFTYTTDTGEVITCDVGMTVSRPSMEEGNLDEMDKVEGM